MNTEEVIKAIRSAPIVWTSKNREHKTIKVGAYLRDCHERFDFEINSMVSDGWTVDCKSAGGPPEDFVFVAFLSREVPSSPPSDEIQEQIRKADEAFRVELEAMRSKYLDDLKSVIIGEFPEGEVPVLMPKSTYDDLKAKADAYVTYGPDLPRTYTHDEMWLAYHKGWDFGYAQKSTLDSDALFEEFLESLGKDPPLPGEKSHVTVKELFRTLFWATLDVTGKKELGQLMTEEQSEWFERIWVLFGKELTEIHQQTKPTEIGEKTPTERPSNDLLKQWFKSAYSIFASQVGPWDEADLFQEWVASLPADSLEADRSDVQMAYKAAHWGHRGDNPTIEFHFSDPQHRHNFSVSLERLIGKGGESNG